MTHSVNVSGQSQRDDCGDTEKATYEQRCGVPRAGSFFVRAFNLRFRGSRISRHICPALSNDERRSATFGARCLCRSGELLNSGATWNGGEVATTESECLVAPRGRGCPGSYRAFVGSESHAKTHFQTLQSHQWNPPGANYVDDPDHVAVDDDARTPEEHPGNKSGQSKQRPASNQRGPIMGKNESAECTGNQEQSHHSEASPQGHAKYGTRLLHEVSLPQCLVGGERG